MAKLQEERDVHVLVLNPNSSKSMTDGMATAIGKLPLPNVTLSYLCATGSLYHVCIEQNTEIYTDT